jgi:hypothetical protein
MSSYVRELNRTQKAEVGYAKATAALTNEQLTRQRVEKLEAIQRSEDHRLFVLEDFKGRGFRGRLRWLLTGK